MPNQYLFWDQWEERLSRWKLHTLAAELLENGSALTLLFSQALHLTQPFLSPEQSKEMDALAELLESKESSTAFASRLRKERNH
ncbi:MAG: hypothetical protein HPY85_10170 [Anaerolineae bacterium]|jgi:hypothetical protein|nr:hypothetical protein [Anaerolineae bacterium]